MKKFQKNPRRLAFSQIARRDIINLRALCQGDLLEVAKFFADYDKLQSFVLLRYLKVPVLDGFIVRAWQESTSTNLEKMLAQLNWSSGIIRSDSALNVRFKPRGGDIILAHNIPTAVKKVLGEGRIPFVLAPVSRFDDLYSGNVLFDPKSDWLQWEIVGPGFDMSDLNRGDTVPHERFETARGEVVEDWRHLTALDIRNHKIIESHNYRRSWQARLSKVATLCGLANPTPNRAREFLRAESHPLLLDAEAKYVPLDYENLCTVYDKVADIPRRMKKLGFHGEPCSISFSILERGKLVFWDAFNPQSYEK